MATANTKTKPTQTLFLTFNPKSEKARRMIEALKLLDFLKIEESPYDANYVADVMAMDKSTFKPVKRESIWD